MALMYMSASTLVVGPVAIVLCAIVLGAALAALSSGSRRGLIVLALIVASAQGPARAQEPPRPPTPPPPVIFYTCTYLEPYSLEWWLAGCWAVLP